jgi:histidinol-phosphate phosphatase family protein
MIHKPGDRSHGVITNAALYILNPECFAHVPPTGPFDFGRQLLPALIAAGFKVHGYPDDGYMLDVGTVARYEKGTADLRAGRLAGRVDAVFLDRDGVINELVDQLHRPEDFRLLPGAAAAIRKLNEAQLPVIVVTNQPAVARNLCTEAGLAEIHAVMEEQLRRERAYVDRILYCPHHPEKHHADGNPAYRMDCDCRKPRTGMLTRARRLHDLDLARCFLVGDTSRDTQTGRNAGCQTIIVKTGAGGADGGFNVAPDFVCENLTEAAELIVAANRAE